MAHSVAKVSNITIMKALFLTFGDGSTEFRAAAIRLAEQAKSIGVFSSVVCLNHESLLQVSEEYVLAQSSIINLDTYPTFFRAAKAWVVQAGLLGKFGEFDLVCYADAGCEIASNRITRLVLIKSMQKALLHGGLAEQLPLSERSWTKKRTMEYFHPSEADALSGQVQSGLSFWRVDNKNIELATRWCLLSDSKLNLWQNSKNRSDEEEYFKEHRHDQSIFSLLWKQAGLLVEPVNSQWTLRLPNIRSASIPIHTIRNRTGTSKLTRLSNSNFAAILGLGINLLGKVKR